MNAAREVSIVVLKMTILSIFQKHPHHAKETMQDNSKKKNACNPRPIHTSKASGNNNIFNGTDSTI